MWTSRWNANRQICKQKDQKQNGVLNTEKATYLAKQQNHTDNKTKVWNGTL